MTSPFADRLFCIVFALAGCYNLAFGLWTGLRPLEFFELFEIAPPRYPGIWACLGMVVGVYGLLYWHAAWKLATAWPIIAVGMLGKVLGPIGMALSFGDDWPRRLGMICIFNDLIWWLPFGLFLIRGTWLSRQMVQLAPWLCAALHAAALVALAVLLRPGLLTEPDTATRAAYLAENTAAWTLGWSLWMLAAMSLVGFYAWWGGALAGHCPNTSKHGMRTMLALAAVLIAGLGMVFDFTGEGLSVLRLVELAAASDTLALTNLERTITLLTAGAANGLYTLAGLLLMIATPDLPAWIRALMSTTWLAGLAMTVAGAMNHVGGMVASTAVLFPLLIVWVAWMGARWRRP